MSELEMIMQELKTLPPQKLKDVAGYIHSLSEIARTHRQTALEQAYGSLSEEDADVMAKAIKANCERINAGS